MLNFENTVQVSKYPEQLETWKCASTVKFILKITNDSICKSCVNMHLDDEKFENKF